MAVEIHAWSADDAYVNALNKLKIFGTTQPSRNGPVVSITEPVELTLHDPTRRVMFNAQRNANPFFHVMEFVWMMAGEESVYWLAQFNKRMYEYADDGAIHGAYGHRWRVHFGLDQIQEIIDRLRKDQDTRQAVLTMWDPAADLGGNWRDRPCNTHAYFRVVNRRLDMTVCNRSNDVIWGMLGANIVHMTMLHELIALASGLEVGIYRAYTNNLHIYEPFWGYLDQIPSIPLVYPETFPLLQEGETFMDFTYDCRRLIRDEFGFTTLWMNTVGGYIHNAYLDKPVRETWMSYIRAEDWRLGCQTWNSRVSSSTKKEVEYSDSTPNLQNSENPSDNTPPT